MLKISEQSILDAIEHNYMPYSAHVILHRALPEIDGFKPSQRRILYTMYKMGLLKGARKKSQAIVGQTMFLHPHGDATIYETMVNMSVDNENLLIPYVDSKGNFGKKYSRDGQYASARYTEARLTKIAGELFRDINNNTVPMVANYDNTLVEPRMLPVTYPTILTNPQQGIANGMANEMASYNLTEVIDYTIAYLRDRKVDVMDYIKAPDFPSGGQVIYDEGTIRKAIETGSGKFEMRAKYEFLEDNIIRFYELPYGVTIEEIIDRITDLIKQGKIKDIIDINDAEGIGTTGIEINVKSNTNKEVLVERLYKLTRLQAYFNNNFNIVVDGRPKVIGVTETVREWLKFRASVIRSGAMNDKQKKENIIHLYSALESVLLDLDKAIAIIRSSANDKEFIQKLMIEFDIDSEQAEYVAEIKLRNMNESYLNKRIEDIEKLEAEVNELETLINNKMALAKLIIEQLTDIKERFGTERKTSIISADEIKDAVIPTEAIDNYNIKIFVTKENYLKKVPLTSLRGNPTMKLKHGDSIVKEIETTNDSDILVFTDLKNVYKIKTHELEDNKASALGEFLPVYLGLKDEQILYVTATNDYSGNLIIGFEDGKVAKIDLKAYWTKQNRSMLKKAYADKTAIFFADEEDFDLLALSNIGKVVMLNTDHVNSKSSKGTQGVVFMKPKADSNVVAYYRASDLEVEDLEYYRISNAGVGKNVRTEDKNIIIERGHE